MPEIAVYATDLHGEMRDYERLLEAGSGKNVRAVIIGGDICPFLTAAGDIEVYQRDFIEFYLLPRLKEFKESGKKVFLMMGNDDLKSNEKLLREGEKQGLFSMISQKVLPLGKRFIAGYSYVNETPFILKDWERPDERMKKDLDAMARMSDPRKTIYVTHAPPLGTDLDVIFSGSHVGSSAITRFIVEKQPYLTLHGHIHESPQMTGNWMEVIGKTVAVNPGKRNIVVFDINDLKTMQIMSA